MLVVCVLVRGHQRTKLAGHTYTHARPCTHIYCKELTYVILGAGQTRLKSAGRASKEDSRNFWTQVEISIPN